jgi:ketosteroid isomerase-like protein
MLKLFKKKLSTLLLMTVFCAVLIISVSSIIASDKDNNKSEAQKIIKLEKMWSDKFSEGDLKWIVSLHATNAIQLPPGGEMIQGKEALKAAWEGMINTEGLEISWESIEAHVSESGDMAYDFGTVMIKNPDGSKVASKYLVVWTKENGEWKVIADMFNSNGM